MNKEMLNDFCNETELLLLKLKSRLYILSSFTIADKYPKKSVKAQHCIQNFNVEAINEYCNVLRRYITEAREINERGEENDN